MIKIIVGIIGDRGSGKTLYMVKEALTNYKRNRKVVSNFHLNFPVLKGCSQPELLNMSFITDFKKQLHNICLLIDEIYIYIDSRNSASKQNRIWSYFFNQTRKRDVDLYYSTQFFHQVDKRLRSNTELFIFPSKIIKDDVMYIKIKVCKRNMQPIKIFAFKGSDYFPFYDTDEIIDLEIEK